MLNLDHVSLAVGDFERHVPCALEALGFELLRTGRHVRHSRVFLDGSYVEVSEDPDASPLGTRDDTRGLTRFFLRHGDLEELARALGGRELPVRDPFEYRGHDGVWLDLAFDLPALDTVLPIVVRRVEPPEVAREWPPALGLPQPNGARDLRAVCLAVDDLDRACSFFRALLVTEPRTGGRDEIVPARFLEAEKVRFGLPDRRSIVLVEPASKGGPLSRWVKRRGTGIFGAVFGTHSLGATASFFEARGIEFAEERDGARTSML